MTAQTITEFIAARLDDDEAYARNAFRPHGDEGPKNGPEWREIWSGTVECGPGGEHIATFDSQLSRHIERHDPARVLREVAAKRAILKQYQAALTANQIGTRPGGIHSISSRIRAEDEAALDVLSRAVAHLAAAYADHPDYREEWRP